MAAAQEQSNYRERHHQFEARLRELLQPYQHRIEYGNLRSQPSDWETPDGRRITNFAIVYETPVLGAAQRLRLSVAQIAAADEPTAVSLP